MRTNYCGEITEKLIDKPVTLCGWVHRRRDLGGLIFITLRDREGIVQIVCNPEQQAVFKVAETIRSEYILRIEGFVRARPEGTINADMVTGTVEIEAQSIEILCQAEPPPFSIDNYVPVNEEVRLRYRYIDLRRPEMVQNIKLRARLARAIRTYLDKREFLEIETPVLTKATPEGARDYLVPSRVHKGHFYALPQSPQLFKQILMMAGMDRYYQIVKCFRDEDLRADRQPEFTQLDLEMSFVDEQTIQNEIEGLMHFIFKEVLAVELPVFKRMTYAEAIRRFGSDKPDLRIALELVDLADLLKQVDFKVFASAANDPEGRIAALRLPKGVDLSRKILDEYNNFVGIYGAKGLAYIKVNDLAAGIDGLQSSILKFLPEAVIKQILARVQAQTGDVIFFCADKTKIVNEALGALRIKLAEDHNLIEPGWRPLWVTDFPMFEWNNNRWESSHHPFTAPAVADVEAINKNPGSCLSRAWDMVLNGSELGSGSIRINDVAMQKSIFKLLGISEAEAQDRFGFLLEAMKYGCPPIGGMGIGFGRIAMLMAGATSLRDVIAFPKTTTANCLLTDAPSTVTREQINELGIKI